MSFINKTRSFNSYTYINCASCLISFEGKGKVVNELLDRSGVSGSHYTIGVSIQVLKKCFKFFEARLGTNQESMSIVAVIAEIVETNWIISKGRRD